MKIKVDFNDIVGKIKPMHGVGQPPFAGVDFSMFKYLKDAGVPYSRLLPTRTTRIPMISHLPICS